MGFVATMQSTDATFAFGMIAGFFTLLLLASFWVHVVPWCEGILSGACALVDDIRAIRRQSTSIARYLSEQEMRDRARPPSRLPDTMLPTLLALATSLLGGGTRSPSVASTPGTDTAASTPPPSCTISSSAAASPSPVQPSSSTGGDPLTQVVRLFVRHCDDMSPTMVETLGRTFMTAAGSAAIGGNAASPTAPMNTNA